MSRGAWSVEDTTGHHPQAEIKDLGVNRYGVLPLNFLSIRVIRAIRVRKKSRASVFLSVSLCCNQTYYSYAERITDFRTAAS